MMIDFALTTPKGGRRVYDPLSFGMKKIWLLLLAVLYGAWWLYYLEERDRTVSPS